MRRRSPRAQASPVLPLYLAACLSVSAAWAESLVIRAGRIETAAGPAVEQGAIVITDGRIAAVGKDVAVPAGAQTLDLPEAVVAPGFVHPMCRLGLSNPPEGDKPATNPHLRAADELYPYQDIYKYAAAAGFTTLCLTPTQQGIAGQGALVRTVGDSAEAMLISDRGPLVIGFQSPSTELRETIEGALEKGKGGQAGDRGAVLTWAVKGQVPTLVRSSGPGAVLNLLDILQPYKDLKAAVYAPGDEIQQVAPQLVAAKVPIILPAVISFQRFTRIRLSLPRLLAEGGVKVCCIPASQTAGGFDGFRALMAEQLRAGLPREVALRSMTLTPAEILGLDYRLGSLEVGKDANLVILSGDVFDPEATVQRVLIEGRTVYDAAWGGIR